MDCNWQLSMSGEGGCAMCSGEYCAKHFRDPCDCDVIDRHEEFSDEKEIE